jgi:hypothetical protein
LAFSGCCSQSEPVSDISGQWLSRPGFFFFPESMNDEAGYEARFLFSCVDDGLGYETSAFFLFCVDGG